MSNRAGDTDSRIGVAAGLAAYGLWGMMPLYFAAIHHVPASEILAQRIVWSALFLAVLVTFARRWAVVVRGLHSPKVLGTFFLTSAFLSINWLTYIHGVVSGQTVETSLGYFINPLLNVLLGVVFFRERLRPLQVIAVALATGGVLNLVFAAGHFPWIALTLATSFALYGMVRKIAPADALVALTYKTFILLGPAFAFGAYLAAKGELHLVPDELQTDALLMASGVITAVPLLFFGLAARNIRLSTLGFLQFLAPSVQFVLAVTVLHETMNSDRWWSFAFIWAALAIYSLDIWRSLRKVAPGPTPTARTAERAKILSTTPSVPAAGR